jgi:hypothetical protein
MTLYWKIACWISLVGSAIGLVYGLANTSTITTFQIVWMALQLAVAIKTLELGKEAEIKKEESK